MEKLLLLLVIFYATTMFAQAQTTYYCAGIAAGAGAPADWSANRNTPADGTGIFRSVSLGITQKDLTVPLPSNTNIY